MLLQNFPGQDQIKKYFKKIISEDRIPHAILMVGQSGYGSLALAYGLAAAIQCKNPKDSMACGECVSCNKTSKYIHPDIHFSFPVVKIDKIKREDTISQNFLIQWRTFLETNIFGNLNDWLAHIHASDKAANINVTECTQIIKNLSLKTYEGKYKIQIIWYAELLGKEGNKLLKLIEEPTPDTIIILTCHNRNAILNTIRSRCQIVTVPPIEDQEIQTYLNENFQLSDKSSSEIKHLASGDIHIASQLASQNQINYSEDILNWFRYAYKADPEELTQWVAYISGKAKQDIKNFLAYSLHFLREYLLGINMNNIQSLRLSDEEKDVILKMQKIIDRSKTESLEKVFSRNIAYIDRNLSVKILIMNMSLEINEILRSEVNNFV